MTGAASLPFTPLPSVGGNAAPPIAVLATDPSGRRRSDERQWRLRSTTRLGHEHEEERRDGNRYDLVAIAWRGIRELVAPFLTNPSSTAVMLAAQLRP